MERNTSQKQIIIDYLCSVKTHPTAEEVFDSVKKILPGISKGTVYRVLNNYTDKGAIQEIYCKTGHYDADISQHAHLVCKKCAGVFDVYEFHKTIKSPGRVKSGKVDSAQLLFHGTCNACLKTNNIKTLKQ